MTTVTFKHILILSYQYLGYVMLCYVLRLFISYESTSAIFNDILRNPLPSLLPKRKPFNHLLSYSQSIIFNRKVLLKAAATKRFRLIVVDTRPLNEGLQTLAAMSPYMRCVHTPLSGAAVVMREATRVILGENGCFMSGVCSHCDDIFTSVSFVGIIRCVVYTIRVWCHE